MNKETQQEEFRRLVEAGMDKFEAADLVTQAAAEQQRQLEAGRRAAQRFNADRFQTPKNEEQK